jgi:radical SAM protein with 4Fe4S-binding SPASM domain
MTQKLENQLKEATVKFLQIEPTTRCNFKCKFCLTHQMESADLSWETFVTTLEQLPDLEYVKIQGQGEPLLHPLFFDMVKLASNRGIKVSTISNGSLFTPANIDKILDSGLYNLQISIESPNTEQFKEIRGGNLEKIKEGIKLLTTTKKQQGLTTPTVGFAVMVLKKTKHLLPEIANLYNELNMDGGMWLKFLSEMDKNTDVYDEETSAQILSSLEKVLSYSKYQKLIKSEEHHKSSIPNFYEELHQVGYKESQNTPYTKENNPTCPWLDQALYIDRRGEVTPCCHIIETNKFSLGKIGETNLDLILQQRENMKQSLQSGIIPPACRHCFVAESIVNHHHQSSKGE